MNTQNRKALVSWSSVLWLDDGATRHEASWFLCIPEALWNIPAFLFTFTLSASPIRLTRRLQDIFCVSMVPFSALHSTLWIYSTLSLIFKSKYRRGKWCVTRPVQRLQCLFYSPIMWHFAIEFCCVMMLKVRLLDLTVWQHLKDFTVVLY